MKLVYCETPYAAPTARGIALNVDFARACAADCLRRGEAPFLSHLLYTQEGILRDEVPGERALGMAAGFAWAAKADATVVYMDHGVSGGMREGIKRARAAGRPLEFRSLRAMFDERFSPPRKVRITRVRLDGDEYALSGPGE